MKKYALHLVLIFSLAVNFAVAGTLIYHYWREGRPEARLMCDQKPWPRFLRENLGCKDEEFSRFRSLFAQDKKDLFQIRNQIQQQRQILVDLLGQPEVDPGRVDQQIEKIAALQVRMERIVVNRLISMKSSLPEEKQQRLLDIIRQGSNCGPFSRGPRGPGFRTRKRRW